MKIKPEREMQICNLMANENWSKWNKMPRGIFAPKEGFSIVLQAGPRIETRGPGPNLGAP